MLKLINNKWSRYQTCSIRFPLTLNMKDRTVKINIIYQTSSFPSETMCNCKNICKTNTTFRIKNSPVKIDIQKHSMLILYVCVCYIFLLFIHPVSNIFRHNCKKSQLEHLLNRRQFCEWLWIHPFSSLILGCMAQRLLSNPFLHPSLSLLYSSAHKWSSQHRRTLTNLVRFRIKQTNTTIGSVN